MEQDLQEVVDEEEEEEEEKESIARGSAEEAQAREHQLTHLPKTLSDTCEKATAQRRHERRKTVALLPDTAPKKAPVQFW